MNREELAWAGGFFSGEGSTSIHTSRIEEKTPYPQLTIQQNTREELDRFRNAVGLGKVYGPYSRRQNDRKRSDFYHYGQVGFEKVQAIVAMLWPWLSSAKQVQAVNVLKEVA